MGGVGLNVPATGRGNAGPTAAPKLLTFALNGSMPLPAPAGRD
jgi:hypothetical protein